MRFITLKKEQNNISKCSVFASSALLYLFFTSNFAVFVDGEGAKEYFLPQGAEYPSYASVMSPINCIILVTNF